MAGGNSERLQPSSTRIGGGRGVAGGGSGGAPQLSPPPRPSRQGIEVRDGGDGGPDDDSRDSGGSSPAPGVEGGAFSPSKLSFSESVASGSSSSCGSGEAAHAGSQFARPGLATAAAFSPSRLGAGNKSATQARYNKPSPAPAETRLPPQARDSDLTAGSTLDAFKHRPKLTH